MPQLSTLIMKYSARSFGPWHKRSLLFGAIAIMGARSYAAAFQPSSPCHQRALLRKLSPLAQQQRSTNNVRPQQSQSIGRIRTAGHDDDATSSLSMQKEAPAFTGWINSDTLSFQESNPNEQFNEEENGAREDKIINEQDSSDTKVQYPSPSTVEPLLIRDRLVYVKRDDALHLPLSNISGNKARKFLSLNNIPAEEFPDAIVSYGGPQSNAMVALAAIVSSKNAELTGKTSLEDDEWQTKSFGGKDGEDMFWELDVTEEEVNGKEPNGGNEQPSKKGQTPSTSETNNAESQSPKKRFVYYTKTLPRYLRNYPNGNLLRALALGMEIRTVSHEEYNQLFGGLNGGSVMAPADLDPPVPGRSLWIPQGGACSIAKPGSDVQAREIVDYWSVNGKGMPLAVCVPGGTCTTALLLHQSIDGVLEQRKLDGEKEAMDIRLIVIPCVGDDEYAIRQMISLDRSVGGQGKREDMPWVLKPRSDAEYGSARRKSKGYFRFGEPAKAILQTFDEMNENGLFLDLLYGAPAWSLLLQHWRSRDDVDCPIAGRQVMYVHSGGLEGIASQLTRYKHKGLIDARTAQTS